MQSSLYKCTVFHRRLKPRSYQFSTDIFMWLLDLDEIDLLAKKIPILSRNQPNVYSFRDDDHLYLGKDSLRENVIEYLRRNGISENPNSIFLLTNLRTFGYVFNPVSFFFCLNSNNQPIAIIAEVHNTFGELKPFLIKPDSQQDRYTTRQDKHFYISPFSHLDHDLEIRVKIPKNSLSIQVNNFETNENKPFFISNLSGKASSITLANLLKYTLRFPLITLKVICLIHWHALQLYLKKVPFHPKKNNAHLQKGILPKKHQSLKK